MVCTFIFLKKFVFNMKIIIYYWFLVLVGGKILLPKWNLAGKNNYLVEENGYLAEKNGNLAEKTVTRRKKMVTGWKNHVTFLHFTWLARENCTKSRILKNIDFFEKNEHTHCVYGMKIHHICSFKFSWYSPFKLSD